jgi:hypothetical protein
VQLDKAEYLSPCPAFERQIPARQNANFSTNIEALVTELTTTMDNLSSLMKDLEFTNKECSAEVDESLRNVSNISIPHEQPPHPEPD